MYSNVTTNLSCTIGNDSKESNVQKCHKRFMPVCGENCSDIHQNDRYDIVIDSLVLPGSSPKIQMSCNL